MCNYPSPFGGARCFPHARVHLVYFNPPIPDSFFNNHSYQVSLFTILSNPSLRVNLDLGKLAYAYQIEHDPDISGTIVRTSTIPEELGRIEYLFTDKTGTITKNGIHFSDSSHSQIWSLRNYTLAQSATAWTHGKKFKCFSAIQYLNHPL